MALTVQLTTCRCCGYADTSEPTCPECGYVHAPEAPVASSHPERIGRDLALCVASGLLQVLSVCCFAVFAIVDSVTAASQTWEWLVYLLFFPLICCSLAAGVRIVGLRHLGVVPGWVHAGVVFGAAAVAMTIMSTQLDLPFTLFPYYMQWEESLLGALGLGLLATMLGIEHERIARATGTPAQLRAARTTTRVGGAWITIWAFCTPLVVMASGMMLDMDGLHHPLSACWLALLCVYGYYAYRSGVAAIAALRRARFRVADADEMIAAGRGSAG